MIKKKPTTINIKKRSMTNKKIRLANIMKIYPLNILKRSQ